jgi:hypothetical protein
MIAKAEIHVGDIGTRFDITVVEDGEPLNISSATTKELIFRKTDKTTVTKEAAFVTNGADGKIRYVTADGDLDQAGVWKLQVHLILPDGEWKSNTLNFTVHENLI